MRKNKKRPAVFLGLGLLLLGMIVSFCSFVPAKASYDHVVDQAGLLTSGERSKLDALLDSYIEKTRMDLVVVTTDDAGGKTAEEYADDFYDENGYGIGKDNSGALLLIDMDNRKIWISTTGKMIDRLTDAKIDNVIDAGYDDLVDGDYDECLTACVQKLGKYARGRYIAAWEAVAALILGLAAAFITKKTVKANYKVKKNHAIYPYREKSNFALMVNSDAFVNTFVTTRVIASSSGSGGGSSTHTGGSGTTHGGGGRSF